MTGFHQTAPTPVDVGVPTGAPKRVAVLGGGQGRLAVALVAAIHAHTQRTGVPPVCVVVFTESAPHPTMAGMVDRLQG